MAGKFSQQAEKLNASIRGVFQNALATAIAEGFEETVHSTRQDSSNAVVHWMVGAYDGSNASRRTLGAPTDLRATKTGIKHPWVGRRGEHRSDAEMGVAIATADKVLAREVKIAIDRYVYRNPATTKFYVFNAFLDIPKYARNARLKQAAEAGLARAKAVFDREVTNPHATERARRAP